MRPTRNKTMLKIASIVAERGTCDRKQVGAVIAREGRVISVGYNGAPPGLPHCDENYHGWLPPGSTIEIHDPREVPTLEDWTSKRILEQGCRNATHAEANALAFAAKYGVSTDGAELFVTVSPCENCARLLIAAGIVAVHYLERYRSGGGNDLLLQTGITIEQHES